MHGPIDRKIKPSAPQEFISKDRNVESRVDNNNLWIVLATSLVGLTAGEGYLHFALRPDSYTGRFRYSVITSLADGNWPIIVIAMVAGALLGLIVVAIRRSHYNYDDREIVVGLKFNDEAQQLTLSTKTVSGQAYKRIFKYKELVVERNRLTDGLTYRPVDNSFFGDTDVNYVSAPREYSVLTLVKGTIWVAHIFEDHFTWEDSTLSAIKTKLREVIRFA